MTASWVTSSIFHARCPQVYYINLDRRPDRLAAVETMLDQWKIPTSKRRRITAVDLPDHPRLGCSLSHIKAIEAFLASDSTTCIVLEDDFVPQVHWIIAYMMVILFRATRYKQWDVVMLAANVLQSRYSLPFVRRTSDSQTTAGFMVAREYAPILLENFQEGADLLARKNSDYHAIDMHMKRLQKRDRWYVFSPRIGKQEAGHSDIERTYVDYGV